VEKRRARVLSQRILETTTLRLGARHLALHWFPALPPCCSNRPTATSQARFWSATLSARSRTRRRAERMARLAQAAWICVRLCSSSKARICSNEPRRLVTTEVNPNNHRIKRARDPCVALFLADIDHSTATILGKRQSGSNSVTSAGPTSHPEGRVGSRAAPFLRCDRSCGQAT
jgi:hypothetical protein